MDQVILGHMDLPTGASYWECPLPKKHLPFCMLLPLFSDSQPTIHVTVLIYVSKMVDYVWLDPCHHPQHHGIQCITDQFQMLATVTWPHKLQRCMTAPPVFIEGFPGHNLHVFFIFLHRVVSNRGCYYGKWKLSVCIPSLLLNTLDYYLRAHGLQP